MVICGIPLAHFCKGSFRTYNNNYYYSHICSILFHYLCVLNVVLGTTPRGFLGICMCTVGGPRYKSKMVLGHL